MHEIEPYYSWEKYYSAENDPHSPYYGKEYNFDQYSDTIYGYYIHPAWDNIGSQTLYIKIIYANYDSGIAVIEMIGEWNDAIHNDVMFLKRNVVDELVNNGIHRFILIGENVFDFHGSDDCYYEEWFEDIEDGWIAAINFRYFVHDEWRKFGIDAYLNYGGEMEIDNWRTYHPEAFCAMVSGMIVKRLT